MCMICAFQFTRCIRKKPHAPAVRTLIEFLKQKEGAFG
ncbi:hypothetical protein JCM19237_4053 [Photobacterium aphoticum]|uniref:Uncharacterized protein n=1 Tax=Photobacterium aphoticum TaxID=754436 RepID=A0A090RAS1_9GAMM|nr:hypothetical protein JCM19237_4053 [Photobacterium aphoticum]